MALTASDLPTLTLLSRGKVRDIYATSDPDALLFVATDRISAYDVILKNGIPGKGALLTEISRFWFAKLAHIIPNHFITADIDAMPVEVHEYKTQLAGRAMLVRKAQVVPLEAIVRGYLTGSAWAEYQKSGTAHGIALPPQGFANRSASRRHCSPRRPRPKWVPTTKTSLRSRRQRSSATRSMRRSVRPHLGCTPPLLSTRTRGDSSSRTPSLSLGLFLPRVVPLQRKSSSWWTNCSPPDSSRYWPAAGYEPGRAQPSFDKQYLRDWLVGAGFRKGLEAGPTGSEGWVIEESVVEGTRKRYEEVVAMLTAA
ncbi:SAICAR synthetase [Mycena venus]|uniref:Phosphoribosylaminoimidazole-succinocarboxamide synthase n=1 Tax=Mycena venus TaxID=2733690 RepID=A0A8H6Y5W5_9AGAR|nr:SAICAR synthetase [Mycena venus]